MEARQISSKQVKGDAIVYYVSFFKVKPNKRRQPVSVYWSRPQHGSYKLNTDASVKFNGATGGSIPGE